jgi:FAD/FMN-containing dehydrogenase/Fe-S oxidoreductase
MVISIRQDPDLAGPGAPDPGVTPAELTAALRRAGLSDVSASSLDRAAYSSDASCYRVVPAAVARPRDADEVAAALAVCRDLGTPVTCRGAGTSIAGNAVGTGLVLDFSRHMNQVRSVDAGARTAVVQPGVVQAQLHRELPAGLRFGPDPSSHTRCTIGGMIGNNACGSRALRYGRTSDNVLALDALTASGTRLQLGAPAVPGTPGAALAGPGDVPELTALRDVIASGLAPIRTQLGQFGRQVSGYALEHLLPENGFDVRKALVGSEGTLAVITEATLRLVAEPQFRVLAVLGYPDMASAADAAPGVTAHLPTACEGLDSRIVDAVRAQRGAAAVTDLPRGSGWLFAEFAAATAAEAEAAARRCLASAGALDGAVVTDPRHAAALWRIREDGAGFASRSPDGQPAYPGWEDSAVPPASLGPYLRELEELLRQYRLTGLPYGHFGEGCLHLRLDFPLGRPDGAAIMRAFLLDAARLVARYGGSLSGEHGDGRARSELLPLMYSPEVLDLFRQVKTAFDATGLLNPGILVQPRPLDADLRASGSRPVRGRLALAFASDHGDFAAAVHRCSGVGKCRADSTATGGVMCPSYLATRDEEHSTRGRSRVLQEMVNGTLVTGGWRSPELHEALDLCLSCKACSAECPVGVDMAAYKAEVLHQSYRRRLRPRSHYALGQLPRWARLAARAPRLANAVIALPGAARAARFLAGIDQRRQLPTFATEPLRAPSATPTTATPATATPATVTAPATASSAATPAGTATARPVLLFADTFTRYFSPEIAEAAIRVLEDAGFSVTLTSPSACCAITWISTGQLGAARRILRRTVDELLPAATAGIPIVGLEPSCTATLRSDATELLDTPAAVTVAGAVRTLSELLAEVPGWQPPPLEGTELVAQPHCHHHAVMGWGPDEALLRRAGAQLNRVGGCCGLAGNFGVERGHYEVSVAVAENALLPAVKAAAGDAVLLADGFSCRTQLADLTGRPAQHLAQLLDPHPPGGKGGSTGGRA